jgi:peroxiredoxin Q/BCP
MLSTSAAVAADPMVPAEGTKAPGFSLTTQEGTPASLDGFRGKWVVLYFYPKDFTTGCTIEAHNFQRDQQQYHKLNAVVLGVSLDSNDSHKQFCTKEGLEFKLLSDADHAVSKAYGSTMDYNGTQYAARNTFIINPDGVIAKVFTKVNPSKHSEDVLAALQELQAAHAAHASAK